MEPTFLISNQWISLTGVFNRSEKQKKKMLLGGNKRLYNYLKEYDLHQKSSQTKFKSKACDIYRKTVCLEAE